MTITEKPKELQDNRKRVFTATAVGLVIWTVYNVIFVISIFPTGLYWVSYYVADYDFGFVRRGLAGEMIELFPAEHYFAANHAMLWISIGVWLGALAVLMRVILKAGTGSERRTMLALLVPALPFAVSYAVYSPRPELFAMAALLAFAVAVTFTSGRRPRIVLSALYGGAIAILAFVHEAIPLLLALGAVLAVLVLAKDLPSVVQRWCIVLAVGPGLVASLLVAAFGRLDTAAQLCGQVPHGMLENPYAVAAVSPQHALEYMLGRVESQTDYHDWVCPNVIAMLDSNFIGGVSSVWQLGAPALAGSFVFGLLFLVATVWSIGYLSGTSAAAYYEQFRGSLLLPTLALLLTVPVFATGFDWIRWWVVITFDVALAFILFAVRRPEIEQPPTGKHRRLFVIAVVVLALLPTATGAAPHFGGASFAITDG